MGTNEDTTGRDLRRAPIPSKGLWDVVVYKGKSYPSRGIRVKCGSGERDFIIGSRKMLDVMYDKKGEMRDDAVELDEWIFHYVDDDLLEFGSDEDIVRRIEADDVPRSEW